MQQHSPQQSEAALHAVDYWQVIKNRYGVILLTLLLVFMTAAVITYVMPKKYESTAIIEVRPRGALVDPLPMLAQGSGMMRMTPRFFETEFEKIKSRKILIKVMDKLELSAKWGQEPETVLRILRSIVSTQNLRGTDLISIRVRHNKKEDACAIADEVAKAYREYREEEERSASERAVVELSNAVREQQAKAEELRRVLLNISVNKDIIYFADDASNSRSGIDEDISHKRALERYTELQQEKMQLESSIQNLLNFSDSQLIERAAAMNLPDNIIKDLHPKYLEQKRILDALLVDLGDRHPVVLRQRELLSSMQKQLDDGVVTLKNTLQTQLNLAEERLALVEEMKNTTRAAARGRGQDTLEYVEAKREFESAWNLFQNLELKLKSEQIAGDMPNEVAVVIEEPFQAQSYVSPNVTLNLVLGAVVGLVFGVGIALFLEYLDTSVKSLEDVERYLQVPVLAVIPKDVGVLHKQSGMSPDAEAYRILRTNIEFNRKNPEDNSITVVSGGAGEGKSTTLVNLAYICAQGGYTTLMIDADLRRPRLHTFFDINNSVGLTNYLTTELMLEDVILQTPVDNLFFMPSGILPADAAGILNSRRMSELIQDVKQRFDLVLVDSPPILGVSDASVLASEVDLTMIVVQHRKLPRNMLVRVKQAVENVGGNVIGVVLNNVDVRSDSQYQYYTSYYTYYAPAESQVGAPVSSPSSSLPRAQVGTGSSSDSELY
jgi:succinoglycan biosynthesis transport protein ExoP